MEEAVYTLGGGGSFFSLTQEHQNIFLEPKWLRKANPIFYSDSNMYKTVRY